MVWNETETTAPERSYTTVSKQTQEGIVEYVIGPAKEYIEERTMEV
jgi:hypothetical protein